MSKYRLPASNLSRDFNFKQNVRKSYLYRCASEAVETALEQLVEESTPKAIHVAEGLLWFDAGWAERLRTRLEQHEDGRVRAALRQVKHEIQNRRLATELISGLRSATTRNARWVYAHALENVGDEITLEELKIVSDAVRQQWDMSLIMLTNRCSEAIQKSLQERMDMHKRMAS